MGSKAHQIHISFFPFMAQGHMIPVADMAFLFATRGVKVTIITTPLNAQTFSKTIEKAKHLGADISILTIKFPCEEVGLPEGCENAQFLPSNSPEMNKKFFKATQMFEEPLEQLLEGYRPNCLVADMFFPWATDIAAKFGIPRLVFHGISVFALCAAEAVRLYEPHKKVSSDSKPFVLPGLPDKIELTRLLLPDSIRKESEFTRVHMRVRESELKSFGVIANTFYELEPAYVDHYRKVLGRRVWHIGPVSLSNESVEDKAERGNKTYINKHDCLQWLDTKKPNSIIYICFGSLTNFTATQSLEIAKGLEASGQDFIWVVKENKIVEAEVEKWLPEGFDKRIEGKGLIIRGWAPQVLILEHKAIGGFVTHCGWNSTLEGISAGVPMVTWPVFADQFYNEKLITKVLKLGVSVGVKRWGRGAGDTIESEAIEKAVSQIMVGEEAEEIRSRASAFGDMARRAVKPGGSSYSDLDALLQQLKLQQGIHV